MNLLKKLISNIKSRQFSTTKLRQRYSLGDYQYIKKAYLVAPNYLKVQAIEYMSRFENQKNLDFLIREFKDINELKLKSYVFQSILILAENERLIVSKNDKLLLNENFNLLENIGYTLSPAKPKQETIAFRSKLKDHLIDLENKKRLNNRMSGF